MLIKEITQYLESLAPTEYQESYDNAGLITGNGDMICTGTLSCLDSTEAVIDEAIEKGVNLVVAHHPIVFGGLKRFTGKSYVERVIIKAIKHDIAIYAIHTNLDNVRGGVNDRIADQLGLQKAGRAILMPKEAMLRKLEVYVPDAQAAKLREALWAAGAGAIGAYRNCAFSAEGTGTYLPQQGAQPAIGVVGTQEETPEVKVEVIASTDRLPAVLAAMHASHPYEQIAHQILSIDNTHPQLGAGLVGELPQETGSQDFLAHVKKVMQVGALKYTTICHEHVNKVAVLGGSGVFGLKSAIASGAQVFITSDVKYHEYFDADGRIILVDIGHYESEQYTQQLLQKLLDEKFPKFANLLTGVRTNPVNYL